MDEGFERTWDLTKRAYSIYAEVTAPIYDAILRILESGAYLNHSDYVRELIEKDVEERGIELEAIEYFGGDGVGDVIRSPKSYKAGVVSARVPMLMMKGIYWLLNSGFYIRVSDYLRHVIKKDLESRGIEPRFIEAVAEEETAKGWRPSETAKVSTEVPMRMMEEIDGLLDSGFYLRVSDYLIDLIRKDLEARDLSPEV